MFVTTLLAMQQYFIDSGCLGVWEKLGTVGKSWVRLGLFGRYWSALGFIGECRFLSL